MIAAFFRSNQPAVLAALPVVVAALFAPAFWHAPAPGAALMPLAALAHHMLGSSGWAHALLGAALIAAVAVQLTVLCNALDLIDRRNHLVAVTLPVALAGLGSTAHDPALLGLPFLLMGMRRAWSVSNNGPALAMLFDAGLLLGVAALCYLPYAFVLVALWASTSLIRPFAWREYIMPVFAVALAFYLAWLVLHLLGHGPWRPMLTLMGPDGDPAVLWQGAARKAFLILLVAALIVALAAFNRSHARSVMRGKNLRSAFMAFALALCVITGLLALLKGAFPAVLVAVPAAVLLAYPLVDPRRGWLAEAVLIGLFALALWVRWS
jgi:hypothetical protein